MMYEIGAYVYLRPGATLHDPDSIMVLHAVPRDWSAAVSILGEQVIRNGQIFLPVSNPFSKNVAEPVNPYRTDGELGVVLVHTGDIRDPSEVVGMVLPDATRAQVAGFVGRPVSVGASLGTALTKLKDKSPVSMGTLAALGLIAGATALMVARNPRYKWEVLAGGVGLSALALYKETQVGGGSIGGSMAAQGIWG